MAFIGLHNHTERGSNVRLRDSTNRVTDLIEYTHKIGHKGVAITDHECLSVHLDAINYYQSKKIEKGWENYKLLLGNEIYLCTEDVNKDNPNKLKFPHFILIALDSEGHKQLRELSTDSWLNNSFMRSGMMRVPTYYNDLFEKIINNQGHIVASSACIGGALPSRLLEHREIENTLQYKSIWKSCITWIDNMNKVFGQGFFFLELQPSNNDEQIYVNSKLIELSKITNTPYIITTDSHYLTKEDSKVHRAFLNAQEGEREVDSFYATTYVMTEEEIHSYMDKYLGYEVVQKGLDNTLLIYDMAEDYDLKRDLEIPYVPLNTAEPNKNLYEKYKTKLKYLDYFYNSKEDCDRHFSRELLNAFEKDEQYQNQETYKAVDVCLDSIIQSSEKMNVHWSAYLLDVSDLVKLAWEAGAIVGCGRGCFIPDTKVLMADGKVKKIQEVSIGDKVITHKGNEKTVINRFEYDCEEELYKIKSSDSTPITCTNNHEIFAVQTEKCFKADRKNEFTPQWIKAEDLKVGDFLCYPKINRKKEETIVYDLVEIIKDKIEFEFDEQFVWTKDEFHLNEKKINRFITVDEDFCKLSGWFISQGWIRCNKENKRYSIGFIHHSDKEYLIESNIKLINKIFNIQANPIKNSQKQVVQIISYSKIVSLFMQTLFGKCAENKIIPSEFMKMSLNLKGKLIEGLWDGNGCYKTKTTKKTKYSTINFSLAKQVQMLLSDFDIPSSISIKHHKNQPAQHDEISVLVSSVKYISKLNQICDGKFDEISSSFSAPQHFSDGNYIYYKIYEITKERYKGKVYDLGVEDDTSYIVESYVVHNSGVGFIINNMLGITQINPLREEVKTFHWRFLNPERVSPLDIDVDIPKSKRGVVIQKLKDVYGKDRISKVQTVSTEGSRSALLSTCRALNIDNDIASYMTSFIVADRGIVRTLKQTYYGDIENNIKPDKEFISLMNNYPEVWEIAQKIEGLTVGVGSHAGGIVLVDKPFTETAALMKTNSGDIITQYNLHELESMSLIKFDLLSIALDKMQTALELMVENKVIEWQGTLKDTYEKYLGIYNIERNSKDMWELLWEHKVPSFFQFETMQGTKCVDSCKPDSVASLAALNSVMRLMAQEESAEQPIDKYKRFKEDISQWYKEMDEYGLTLEEQELLKTILSDSCGICESQEKFMQLVQLKECGGFSLLWADRLRKSIAKFFGVQYRNILNY